MPALTGVIETAVYADDLESARRFYEDILGLKPMFVDERLCAFEAGGRSVFLVFRRGGSVAAMPMGGGYIPPHDGQGSVHMAFSVDKGELAQWEEHLAAHAVPIESRVTWPRGATSLYFRDPDGNLLELATPGLWPIY